MHFSRLTAFSAMSGLVRAQLAIAGVVLLAAVFAPPPEGEMVVVQVVPLPVGSTIGWVTAHDGRIVGLPNRAPLITVFGHRADLIGPALLHGAVLARLPSLLCGLSSVSTPHPAGDLD
jgi:hypothetical protein